MAERAGGRASYFERPRTRALVFGSFFAIFLPLTVLRLAFGDAAWVTALSLVEIVGLGVTHFFLTLVVFFQSANLDYFASTTRNRIVFFAVPTGVLVLFAALAAADVRTAFPAFAAAFFGIVRILDFFHVGRQSFGMLQLFKRPLGDVAPGWLRSAENTFFVAMAGLQWETFVFGGRFAHDALHAWFPAIALGVLGLVVVGAYAQLVPKAGPAVAVPVAYFAMQAVCAATAAWRTDLYLVALTLHYVEYHAIMMPRWRNAPLDASRALDRGFERVRRRPWLFYGVLLVVVAAFEQREALGAASASTKFLVHAFDGIFVLHYVIDAFLWKFRDPYFRRTLAPLYFPSVAPGPEAAPSADAGGAPA